MFMEYGKEVIIEVKYLFNYALKYLNLNNNTMTAYEIIDLILKLAGILVLLIIWRAILGNSFIASNLLKQQNFLGKSVGDLNKKMTTTNSISERLTSAINSLKDTVDNPNFVKKLEELEANSKYNGTKDDTRKS